MGNPEGAMAALLGLFGKKGGGAAGEDVADSDFFEYQWDLDGRGIISHLVRVNMTQQRSKSKSKSKEQPVSVMFSYGEESNKEEELVMGHPDEVLLWAKAAADGKELSQHPIIRTTNMPESSMTIIFNQHAVIPNFYTIQHGWNTSFYALRHWLFEAQNLKDNEWYVVSEHGPEKHPGPFSFREAHQTASFPVRGKFWSRRLRIRQVGLNSGGFDDLYLSAFEVYGKVRPLT